MKLIFSNTKFIPKSPAVHRHTFLGIFPSYFANQASPQVRELYLNSAMLDLAVSMILFFEPIYLYQKGISLIGIVLFYLGVYAAYLLFIPLGGKFVKRRGVAHSIFLGSPFLIAYYGMLLFVGSSWVFLIPAALFYALQKTFYWPGFHADFAEYGHDEEQGREISTISVILLFVHIAGPVIGGAILYFFNFTALFFVVSFLVIFSNFPLLLTSTRFTPGKFSYGGAFKRIVKRKNRRRAIAYLGFGEELILLVMWPIFIFTIVKSTISAGALVAVSTLITAFVILYIGKLTDCRKKQGVLRFMSVIYSAGWVLRIFLQFPLGALFADTFSRIGKNSLSIPLTAIVYHNARRGDVVERMVFFEMCLIIGKIIALILLLLLLSFVSHSILWQLIFILAALFSLLYSALDGEE